MCLSFNDQPQEGAYNSRCLEVDFASNDCLDTTTTSVEPVPYYRGRDWCLVVAAWRSSQLTSSTMSQLLVPSLPAAVELEFVPIVG